MKKILPLYAAFCVVVLILANLVLFLAILAPEGEAGRGTGFWLPYSIIMLALVLHFICSAAVLRDGSLTRAHYGLPLVSVSFGGLILTAKKINSTINILDL